MKKPIIALVALVVAAGGSLGAFFAVKNKKDKEDAAVTSQIADYALFSFDANSVTSIDFIGKDEEYTVQPDSEGIWHLSTGEFEIDEVYIQLIRTYTSTLTAETSYGKADDEKKAMYGLDDPDTIVIHEPDGTHTLYIGDVSPTGDYYYVMTGDKDNIYALDSTYASVLVIDRLMLKSKKLAPFVVDGIESITFRQDGKDTCEMFYDKDQQKWSLAEEYSQLTVDQTAITAMINAMIRLEAEEMLDEDLTDLKKYGFDDPDGEAVIKGLDGSERSFLVKTMEEDPSYSYVLIEDDGQVEIYYTADMSFVRSTPYKYIDQTMRLADVYTISGFELELDGETDSCTIDANERTCEYNGTEVDIDTSSNFVLLQNFFGTFSNISIMELDTEAEPELKDPRLTAVYHTEDGDITLQLVKKTDELYYIFRNGEYTGALADGKIFSGRTSIKEFRNQFIEILN